MRASVLLAVLAAASLASSAAACGGDVCGLSNGTWTCDGGWSKELAAHCPALGKSCDACKQQLSPGSAADAAPATVPCQVPPAHDSTFPVLGFCAQDGNCMQCDAITTEGACEAVQGCEWAATGGMSHQCQISGHIPCDCTEAQDTVSCAVKGGAPSYAYCAGNCGMASLCSALTSEASCAGVTCSWDANSKTCGSCDLECNGCVMPDADHTCYPSTGIGQRMCATLGGMWQSCAVESEVPCTTIKGRQFGYTQATQGSAASIASDACLAQVSPSGAQCKWSMTADRWGTCGECFADSDCASGICETDKYVCAVCDDTFCGPHGHVVNSSTVADSGGKCQCTCDAGWAGTQCDRLDCTRGKVGDKCAACSHANPWDKCAASDGESLCTSNGQCGGVPLSCESFITCENGGTPQGDTASLCACACPPGFDGPRCESKQPAVVHCDANSSDVTIPAVRSANDDYIRMRTCAAADHKCTSAPGTPTSYSTCAVDMPPQETVSLRLPNATTLLVFVDTSCPNVDFEVWRPGEGWAHQPAITVPNLCGPPEYPVINNCLEFDPAGCPPGKTLTSTPCSNDDATVGLTCTAAMCCSSS